MSEIKGVCVPTCTPFDNSGDTVDEKALSAHLERLLEAGVHAVVLCGGTVEFTYLNEAERRQIHPLIAKRVHGRARFVAQSSAVSTADAIENVKVTEGLGAGALMILPLSFAGSSMDGAKASSGFLAYLDRVCQLTEPNRLVILPR